MGKLRADPHFGQVLAAKDFAGEPQGQLVGSVLHQGYRFRIVRNRLYWRPPEETFHEFLFNVLKWTLGESWYKAQLKVPLGERHQIVKWYQAASNHINTIVGNPLYREGEFYGAAPTGEVQALITLAYDVYHLLHRGDLPEFESADS